MKKPPQFARCCGAKPMFKSKVFKADGLEPVLEVEMLKISMPLLCEAHYRVKSVKTLHSPATFRISALGADAKLIKSDKLPCALTLVQRRKCVSPATPATSPSATPATQSVWRPAATQTPATQSDSPCHQVPRCHAKCAATSRNPAATQRVTSTNPVP